MNQIQNTRIGYVGHSKNLEHPADRRRLAGWADSTGIILETENPLESDLLIITNAANFSYWIKRAQQPVILDLVDGYIGESPHFFKDLIRNILRSRNGSSSLSWITYTRHIKYACRESAAIVVASPEQKKLLMEFNQNVWVITDDHHEIDLEVRKQIHLEPKIDNTCSNHHLFWEGLGFTLKHFKSIARELDQFLYNNNWGMYLVTVHKFKRWGATFGNIHTEKLIRKFFPLSFRKIMIVPWSLENLVTYAKASNLAIIPINLNDRFATMKSENKLLSMWHLGLPTFCSEIPSYLRLEKEIGHKKFCINLEKWNESLIRFDQEINIKSNHHFLFKNYIDSAHSHEVLIKNWTQLIVSTLSSFRTSKDGSNT